MNEAITPAPVVAVARKLAVLLLRLWRTSEVCEPLYDTPRREQAA